MKLGRNQGTLKLTKFTKRIFDIGRYFWDFCMKQAEIWPK
jgi:hypothetical protein